MNAKCTSALVLVALSAGGLLAAPAPLDRPTASATATDWRDDPAWHAGPAEWALYDAVRPIYGVDRHYEATIFTNKQRMDPATTTKSSGDRADGTIEVFKHNLSEMIPTENYTYRFLTTCFVRTDTLAPYKLVFSSQEDCGTTYKQILVEGDRVRAEQFCYFPESGAKTVEYAAPDDLAFHDTLSLTLRDYPFDAAEKPRLELDLVPDQTDTHETPLRPESATVEHVGEETVSVPYGRLPAHHLCDASWCGTRAPMVSGTSSAGWTGGRTGAIRGPDRARAARKEAVRSML